MDDAESLEDQLVHSIWRQDRRTVARLLMEGADPNAPGRSWSSSIACAGENDETGEIVRLLVEAGADLDLQDHNGWTPLMHAVDGAIDGAVQGNTSINWLPVQVVLSLGANHLQGDHAGRTVFDLADLYGPRARVALESALSNRP